MSEKPNRHDDHEPPVAEDADNVAPDDPHKVEKLLKVGQPDLDPNAGTE